MRRATLLDTVEIDEIPSKSVKKYFEEAHRCFLYGFPVATAVLCRAVLEARLDELRHRLDPNEELRWKAENAPPGKSRSYYKLVINKAVDEGLLEDTRPLLGRSNSPHWAEEIIDAGNWANHKLDKFNERYGGEKGVDQLSELLAITRKALIQLLTKQQG